MSTQITPRGETLRIYPRTYRGRAGFVVSGGTSVWDTSIFTTTRASAEHIRRKLYAGLEIELPDFAYGEDGSVPLPCDCGEKHVQIGAGL